MSLEVLSNPVKGGRNVLRRLQLPYEESFFHCNGKVILPIRLQTLWQNQQSLPLLTGKEGVCRTYQIIFCIDNPLLSIL